MRASAKVVEWNDDRGFGWLATDGGRVFLHVRDISKRDHWPQVGDIVSFEMGKDAQGRPCAKNAEQVKPGGGFGSTGLFVLVSLLIAPVMALVRIASMPLWKPLLAVVGVMNLFAFLGYWIDKRRAVAGRWRISEGTLHLQELLGGWPGAFIAQRLFRHKTSKPGYQAVFWLIVAAHEFVAVDFLLGWKLVAAFRAAVGL